MKLSKKILVSTVVSVVLCCFVVGYLLSRYRASLGMTGDQGGSLSLSVLSGFCVFAAVAGLLFLWWEYLRFSGGISRVTDMLRQSKTVFPKSLGDPDIDVLCRAIEKKFSGNTSYIEELEDQINNTQIKVQLLRQQKRSADAIIYSIRDAVVVVDEYENLSIANEAAENLFGFNLKNSKSRAIGELIDAEKYSEFLSFMSQSGGSKSEASRREIEFGSGGERRFFNCIVSCVHDEKDRVCGVVAVLHDITREKEISQMKNDFVSHVSHELKTPLASISAYVEMLVDGEAQDEQTRNEFYGIIQKQSERLNRLINDILNISRIESGLIKVKKETVSLPILIQEQVQMIKSYAEEKNIKVIGTDPGDMIIFGQVCIDRDMISQVIVNLLSNAVKYTRSGGSVKIETEIDENDNVARVIVSDTGVGIPAEEVSHVFDKFYRVEKNNKQAQGTGLGLNLVKQIVESVHGGRVFVESEVGVGSKFGFELPLATVEVVESV